MVIDMNESRLNTVAQLRAFLEGTLEVQFCPLNDDTQRYAFIHTLVQRFGYATLGRAHKGVVLRYLERTTGYSRQQLTRLVGRARNGGVLAKRYRVPEHGFARKFNSTDVAVLAETDALHATLSGPATVHLLRRAYALYGDTRYERLAGLSVSHLYNLRAQAGYQAKRGVWTKTKGQSIAIGERRAPAPEGRAGFIRIDSVHQGDYDGLKGIYHINTVDCVTQFDLVATCERISEAYLLPVLEQLLEHFPFTILGFHADNGSEYINHTVARLLNKLHIEFTKSRPRNSNDNALAETKNAAIVRKHLATPTSPSASPPQSMPSAGSSSTPM
jgi:transposase InsO family protein